MITTFDLSGSGFYKIRVWQEELPSAIFRADAHLEWTCPANSTLRGNSLLTAVEMMKIVGPRTINGLLGASFAPDATGTFNLEISYITDENHDEKFRFAPSLATRHDDVFVGLPEEHVHAIYNVATTPQVAQTFGSGRLVIDHAAYGVVGSSNSGFEKILRCLFLVMCAECGLSEDDLRSAL